MTTTVIRTTRILTSNSILPPFQDLWDLKPTDQKNKVVIVRDKETGEYKEKTIFRYFQSFLRVPGFDDSTGKSYMFSGSRCTEEKYIELPSCLSLLSSIFSKYDNCVVNWYEPEDYIELHSDCTAKLDPNSDIIMINLNEPNTPADRYLQLGNDSVLLEDGLVVTIPKEVKHGVGKGKYKRISVTFRKLK